MKNLILKSTLFGLGVLLSVAVPASQAQQKIQTNRLDKVKFFNAPREVQIIDERPIVRDFREAPSAPSTIDLPPAPQGFGGGSGGGGGGALPMNDLSPTSGMPMMGAPGDPGYRTPTSSSLPLPKSGFGGTNIPARGMAPRTALPNGQSTGVHANLMTPIARQAQPGSGMGAGSRGAMAPAAAPAAAYSRGYSTTPSSGAGYGGSSGGMNSSTSLTGKLLNKLRN